MRRLRFEAYLGSAVDRMASALVDGMNARGWEVDFDPRATDTVRRGRLWSGSADVVWACGLLTVEAIQSGEWDGEIVAAPVFRGQSAPVYHSVLIAAPGWEGASDGLASARIAVNQLDSWSGLRALELHLDPTGDRPLRPALVTGSHRASIGALVAGDADVAAIDHVIWTDWSAQHPNSGLMVLGRTRHWPSPPISVSCRTDADAIRPALLASGAGDAARRVGLVRLEPVAAADYEVLRRFGRSLSARIGVE